MEPNIEVCRTIAVQYGLPLQYVVKEFYVFDVLGQITSHTAPTKDLVFKGGTALNKVYLEKMQRFSEDLDFDFNSGSIKETKEWCKKLAENIKGYEINEFRRVRETVQFCFNYESQLGGKDHVRVDVAAKKIISENPPQIKPAVSEYTQRSVTGFRVYSLEDLVSRKLCAIHNRTEGKDFYDVFNALPLCGKMRGAINKMLESEKSSKTSEKFIEETILKVKKADPKKLRNLTNPFIPSKNRPKNWTELVNELVLRLERRL